MNTGFFARVKNLRKIGQQQTFLFLGFMSEPYSLTGDYVSTLPIQQQHAQTQHVPQG